MMKKMQLLVLSLFLPIFMGHAKKAQKQNVKPGVRPTSMKAGSLVGFGSEVGFAGARNVSVVAQRDGKFVVVAQNESNPPAYFNGSVIRYGRDGRPEVFFEQPKQLAQSLPGSYAQSAVMDNRDGYIVGYTNNNSYTLVRYNADGSVDESFNPLSSSMQGASSSRWGKLNTLAMQQDGKILAGSNSPTSPLLRFTADGQLDTTFNPNNMQANLSSVNAIVVSSRKIKRKHKPSSKAVYGQSTGVAYGTPNGVIYGQSNEFAYGSPNGSAYGQSNGSAYGQSNGSAYGSQNGSAYGQSNGSAYGSQNGSAYGLQNGSAYGSQNGSVYGSQSGTGIANGSQSGTAYGQSTGVTYGSQNAYGSQNGASYGSQNGSAYGQSSWSANGSQNGAAYGSNGAAYGSQSGSTYGQLSGSAYGSQNGSYQNGSTYGQSSYGSQSGSAQGQFGGGLFGASNGGSYSSPSIIVAGTTRAGAGTTPANSATLVGYDDDGTVNNSFHFSGVPAGTTNARFLALANQGLNNVVVAGSSNKGALLLRVNERGQVDDQFTQNAESSYVNIPRSAYNAIVVDPQDRNSILVTGQYQGSRFLVKRYTAEGLLDEQNFGDDGTVIFYDGVGQALALTGGQRSLVVVGNIQNPSKGSSPIMYNVKI